MTRGVAFTKKILFAAFLRVFSGFPFTIHRNLPHMGNFSEWQYGTRKLSASYDPFRRMHRNTHIRYFNTQGEYRGSAEK